MEINREDLYKKNMNGLIEDSLKYRKIISDDEAKG